jgi:ERCC4-type nuclease
MKHFLLFVWSCFLTSFSLAAQHSTDPAIFLESVVRCSDSDGIETVKGFHALKARRQELAKSGVSIEIKNEGDSDEEIKITLSKPLQIDGNKASQFKMCADNDSGFIISADFEGDPDRVIRKLKLKKSDKSHPEDLVSEAPGKVPCKPIYRLRKLGPKKFKLGCDWCNG